MDAQRIERLVREVIAEYHLPLQLLTVAKEQSVWRIVIGDRSQRTFDVETPVDSPLSVIRELLRQRLLANS